MTSQRLVRRHRGLDAWPIAILVLLLAVLAWEIVRSNVPVGWRADWPWKLALLGVAPAAALSGALLALIAARRQLSLTVEPHVGWSSFRDASPILGDRTSWRVLLTNSGGGRAIVRTVEYRVALDGTPPESQPWTDVATARSTLMGAGLREDVDFAVPWISAGAGVAVGSTVEVLALSREGVAHVTAVDVHLTYCSATGDLFERELQLVPRGGIPSTLRGTEGRPSS